MRLKYLNIVFLGLLTFITVSAQTASQNPASYNPNKSTNQKFLPLSEVREGMTGTAYTVFRGTDSEPFSVEILGVLPSGIGPKQDLILGIISGDNANRTKVFAGMSGSPVYIDGKLVGAISYAFPFSTEAICGITPIEQMISMFEQGLDEDTGVKKPKTFSFAELATTEWKPDYSQRVQSPSSIPFGGGSTASINALAGQSFIPIATPLSFNGFSKRTLDAFTPELSGLGLIPVTGVAGGSRMSPLIESDSETLVGGDSVSVELARGDFSIAAAGTVTLRDNKRIYAFGHPFLSLGVSSLPMSESSVLVVVPSLSNSFKIAVTESLVGTMTQDRATGIYGGLGVVPQMIPVTVELQTSRNKRETLNFEIANDSLLTPLLLNMTVFNAISAHERDLGELTISIDGKIKIKNNEPVNVSGRFAGQASARLATNSVVIPAFNLMSSKFDDLDIEGISLTIKSYDESKTAILQRIAVDRTRVRPGDTVEVEAFIRTDSGKLLSQKIPFKIPADTPYGKLKLMVGDGAVMQMNSAEEQFEPAGLADLISVINKVRKNDRLYLQARRVTTGAIIGARELPNLPPSVLATLKTNRTSGGYTPTVDSIVADMEIAPAEYIIAGQQELEIMIVDR